MKETIKEMIYVFWIFIPLFMVALSGEKFIIFLKNNDELIKSIKFEYIRDVFPKNIKIKLLELENTEEFLNEYSKKYYSIVASIIIYIFSCVVYFLLLIKNIVMLYNIDLQIENYSDENFWGIKIVGIIFQALFCYFIILTPIFNNCGMGKISEFRYDIYNIFFNKIMVWIIVLGLNIFIVMMLGYGLGCFRTILLNKCSYNEYIYSIEILILILFQYIVLPILSYILSKLFCVLNKFGLKIHEKILDDNFIYKVLKICTYIFLITVYILSYELKLNEIPLVISIGILFILDEIICKTINTYSELFEMEK